MDIIYFDWSRTRGVIALVNDTDFPWLVYPDVPKMLMDRKKPTRFIGEATFESFDLGKREQAIQLAKAMKHELLTVPTRNTGRWREKLGMGPKPVNQTWETDLEDVTAIREESKHVHLKKPQVIYPDDEFIKLREQANAELMHLRSTAAEHKKTKTGTYTTTFQKEMYAKYLAKQLPEFSSLPEQTQIALGSDGKYSLMLLAAVGIAAKHAGSEREFDRITGLYNHGYPSQIRSDIYHHGWRPHRIAGDISLSAYRRELRWLYRQLRKVDHDGR